MRRFVERSRSVRVHWVATILAASILLGTPSAAVALEVGLEGRNGAGAVERTATAAAARTRLRFGQWKTFFFGRAGSSSGPFTFWSRHPVLLRVTDGFCRGDRFRVYDHGFPILLTSKVGIDPSCDDIPRVTRPARAWLDPSYSKGRFLLQPGFHRVRIQAVTSPFGEGGAWLHARRKPVG
jgi:hypothetical protein